MTNFRKYLLLSFTVALLNAVLLLAFFVPRFIHSDTPQYISTIKYILGDPGGQIFLHRILNPMPILIGAALAPIFGVEKVLIVENVVFYFLSAWLIFLLIRRLYRNEKQAFYGTVLYVTAYPMLAYGLAYLTDLPGWFFYLFSVLISLNFLRKPQIKTALLSGLIAGFGMLFKENVAAAPIFFASLVLIALPVSLKEKFKYLIVFGSAFLVFPIINGFILYKLYSYTYWNAFRQGGVGASDTNFTTFFNGFYMVTPLRIVIEIGRVLLIGWFFVLLGALKEFAVKNYERLKILIAFLPPSLSFFLWVYPHNRMIYIAAPLLMLLGSSGLLRHYKDNRVNLFLEITMIVLYILVNYIVLEFLLRYGPIIQPPGGELFG